jgi:DNA-directed RNA polymerase subunit RPC12/RpoP
LGFLLEYLLETRLLAGKKIDRLGIRAAAERYWVDQILRQLDMDRFRDISYETKLQHLAQFKIFEDLVRRSRLRLSDLKLGRYEQYTMLKNPPTSHLYFKENYEQYLDFLELGFFISKQRTARTKDKNKSSIYALNYGACVANNINYGRPTGTHFRSYQVETIFSVNDIIETYLEKHKELVCRECGAKFPIEKLETIALYAMRCPECNSPGACEEKTFVAPDEEVLLDVEDEEQLQTVELALIHSLSLNDEPMYSVELAAEVDCSYQKAGARAKKLFAKGLLERKEENRGKGNLFYFWLTKKAGKYLERVFKTKVD